MSDQGLTVFSGRYELHRRIARGGMADVYLARDQLLDRPVAVKVLFPEFAADPAFVERFRREAQAAANLNHPNVVGVYDWGEEGGGTYFIVMEYIEGRSLADIIRDEGRLHPDRAAEVAADTAAALAFAHRSGVVHRDVKPGNILLTQTGQVKVTDFGIARAIAAGDHTLTQTGSVMGTATYFSPEQAQGQPVDPRSDIYSLGVVLYEMTTGRPPFSGDSPVAIAYKHVQETPTPPRELNPDIPTSLEAVILKSMSKNPANRYPSAEDLRADLRRFRTGQTVVAEPLLAAPVADATQAVPAVGATQAMTRAHATQVYRDGTQVAAPADYPAEEPPKRAGAFFVVLVLLLLLLGGLLFALWRLLGAGDDAALIAVPSVVSLPEQQARDTLVAAGFEVRSEFEPNDEHAEGVVFAQDPAGGTRLEQGSEVLLRVSQGKAPVAVPNLVGKNELDAVNELNGLQLGSNIIREESDNVPRGEVMRQDPAAGEEVPRDTVINLTVSNGPAPAIVPNVVGASEGEASNALGRAGLVVQVRREFSETVDQGLVIRTDPPPGAELERDSTVTLIVSQGPEPTTTTEATTTTQAPTTTTTAPPATTAPPGPPGPPDD